MHFLDWYDGPMSGVFKLDQSEKWYAFNICYFDGQYRRIFSVIEQSAEWCAHFIRTCETHESLDNIKFSDVPFQTLRGAFLQYTGPLYLMSTSGIEAITYEIVQVPRSVLRFEDDAWDNMDADEEYVAQLHSLISTML